MALIENNMEMEKKLLDNVANSCPFCGKKDLDFQYGTEDREGYPVAVMCNYCGATGPWGYRKRGEVLETIKEWNNRTIE